MTRVLGLPRVPAPPADPAEPAEPVEPDLAEEPAPLEGRIRGSLVHLLLERLDFARPAPPAAEEVVALGAAHGLELEPAHVEDIRAQVAAFVASPLCARLAAARGVRREAGFAFALERGGGGPLLTGFVDVLAREADGTVLVVDYKTDRLADDEEPEQLIARAYATQRMVYALAALDDGARARRGRVRACWSAPASPSSPPSRRPTRPRSPARCSISPRGVLAERWPVADRPHRELCGECPARAGLCSWPEELTLRSPTEVYDDSAGTLAGSGGPS